MMAYKNRAEGLAYHRWYYATHRHEEKLKDKAYNAAHRRELSAGDKAYYRGRKALEVIQVEQLFGDPERFVMRGGHDQRRKQ
jgi:hypothetical protein